MIGLAMLYYIVFTLIYSVIILGPPLLAVIVTFAFARRLRWTPFPNLNGLIYSAVIIFLWFQLANFIGWKQQIPAEGALIPFALRGEHGHLALGMYTIGIWTLQGLLAIVVLFLLAVITMWIFEKRPAD